MDELCRLEEAYNAAKQAEGLARAKYNVSHERWTKSGYDRKSNLYLVFSDDLDTVLSLGKVSDALASKIKALKEASSRGAHLLLMVVTARSELNLSSRRA